ncbi:MAG: hypothetical protein ACR2JM_06665, partial [Mycobacterium sp.]
MGVQGKGRGLAAALGVGAAIVAAGSGVAAAAPDTAGDDGSHTRASEPPRSARHVPALDSARSRPQPAAVPKAQDHEPAAGSRAAPSSRRSTGQVRVQLPQVPLSDGLSFTISPDSIADTAIDYGTAGGDPADGPRF